MHSHPTLVRSEADRLADWLLGDAAAVALMRALFEASQIADDLVDEEWTPNVRSDAMAKLLHLCLVVIPGNAAFRTYQGWLAPLLAHSITQWDCANTWASSPRPESQAFAFVQREALESVLVGLALMLGGHEHSRKVAEESHEYYRRELAPETFAAWTREQAQKVAA